MLRVRTGSSRSATVIINESRRFEEPENEMTRACSRFAPLPVLAGVLAGCDTGETGPADAANDPAVRLLEEGEPPLVDLEYRVDPATAQQAGR
jgi:hypothetical protein